MKSAMKLSKIAAARDVKHVFAVFKRFLCFCSFWWPLLVTFNDVDYLNDIDALSDHIK